MLLFVLLTGAAPPFARLLSQAALAGNSVDAMQRCVSDCLFAAVNARGLAHPISRSAQVACPPRPPQAASAAVLASGPHNLCLPSQVRHPEPMDPPLSQSGPWHGTF